MKLVKICLALLLFPMLASAWWDTQIQVVRQPPTVRDVQAESCEGVPAGAVVADKLAWEGNCVVLQPGGATLAFEQDCRITHYVLHVICRGEGVATLKDAGAKPVILSLRVTNLKTKDSRTWRQRIAYLPDKYEDGGHLYFPIYAAGKYRIEVSSSPSSRGALRVDFLALKDLFGELPRRGEKRAQNLLTKAEITALRQQPGSLALANKLLLEQVRLGLIGDAAKFNAWKKEFFLDVWASKPPRNLHFGGALNRRALAGLKDNLAAAGREEPTSWTLRRGWGAWTFEHPTTKAVYGLADLLAGKRMEQCLYPDDLTGTFLTDNLKPVPEMPAAANWAAAALMQKFKGLGGLAAKRAGEYLRTGNEWAGWEGVCALIAYADLYPDIDFQTQIWSFGSKQFGMNPLGKFLYSGHAWGNAEKLMTAYDQLFPIIQKDRALPAIVRQQVPWIRTNKDLITFLDTNILQHIRDCVDRQVIRAGEGDSERICVKAALIQGPGKAGDWILDLPFTRCHMRMMNRGGLQDHFVSSTNSDGCDYIGSMEYSKARPKVAAECALFVARYKQLGGKPRFDLDDAVAFPNVRNGAFFNQHRVVAGNFTPRIGDWGTSADPPTATESNVYRKLYTYAFERSGDPRFAYWVRHWGRQSESDAFWQRIEKAASTVKRSPFLDNRTRALPGFGAGILEAGLAHNEPWKRTAAILRTGVGQGHGHVDQLSLLFYAKGIRAMPNNGRRGGRNNSRLGRWHNSLEIDEKDFMPKKSNSSGVGWLETVNDFGGDLGYTRGAARSPSHPQVSLFRRDVALVPVGSADAFVFDVFRVVGGKVHTWCSAGPVSPRGGVAFNVPTQASKLPDDLVAERRAAAKAEKPFAPEKMAGFQLVDRYLGGWNDRKQGAADDTVQVTWQVDPAKLPRYYRKDGWPNGNKETKVAVRAWRLDAKGQTLLSAFGGFSDYAIKAAPTRNFVYTRKESATAGLEGAYPTVTEAFLDGSPLLTAVERLAVRGGAKGAMAPAAVRVRAAGGQESVVISDGDGKAPLTVGKYQVQGEFACVAKDNGAVVQLALLGGTHLRAEGFTIEPASPRYAAKVVRLDVPGNSVMLDQAWPAELLDGENFLLRRNGPDHLANFIAKRIAPTGAGSRMQLRGGIKIHQTAITHFHADGVVSVDLPFVLHETDPTYYDNMVVLNEEHQVVGPARFRDGGRFMYMHKPGHQKWRQTFKSLEDIPDANGDGRRVLKMIATQQHRRLSPTPGTIQPGDTMAELEVTRVSASGDMIWFKDVPELYTDSIGEAHRHWPYQSQKLVTEDGKRTLQANYPGDEIYLGVRGKALSENDFPDADGDGRRYVSLSHIAPGDVFETPTMVSLTREREGLYRLRANCAVRLGLPTKDVRLIVRTSDAVRVVEPQITRGVLSIDAKLLTTGDVYLAIPAADGSVNVPL